MLPRTVVRHPGRLGACSYIIGSEEESPLAYFVSLYHTHAMYASTKGMARLTMLIVLRVNSDDEEL